MATRRMWPIAEAQVQRQAEFFPHGAHAKALADAAERRARGEAVAFYEGYEWGQSYVFVGPPLPSGDTGENDG